MNIKGIILGAVSFFVIGVFHPIVIKAEYTFGRKSIPAFAVASGVFLLLSLLWANTYVSVVLGLIGFSSLWSIHEVLQQEKRVAKGWFPRNPKREQKEEKREPSEKEDNVS